MSTDIRQPVVHHHGRRSSGAGISVCAAFHFDPLVQSFNKIHTAHKGSNETAILGNQQLASFFFLSPESDFLYIIAQVADRRTWVKSSKASLRRNTLMSHFRLRICFQRFHQLLPKEKTLTSWVQRSSIKPMTSSRCFSRSSQNAESTTRQRHPPINRTIPISSSKAMPPENTTQIKQDLGRRDFAILYRCVLFP